MWLGPRVKGRIYGAVNEQIFPNAWGPFARKDLAEKYKLDLDAVTKAEDMTPWFDAILQGEGGNVTPIEPGTVLYWATNFGQDDPGYGLVDYNDKNLATLQFAETGYQTHGKGQLTGTTPFDDV